MTTIASRMVLLLALLGLGLTSLVGVATATHPRPKAASPVRVSLVPAYEPCTSPNRTHGPPLAFPSCNPPAQSSSFLTVGTPEANGAAANFNGFIRIAVATDPSGSEIRFASMVRDVRCKGPTSTCGNANAAGGPDYTGELQMDATIRITDHYNNVSAGGGTDPATLVDIPFPANFTCGSTADTSVGATCTINTTAAGGVPNQDWFNGKRVVVEITQLQVFDGGSDGIVATSGNTLFAVQGIWIP